ncbi:MULTISPECIES: DUF2480 family protein [Mesonia]|uniref:Uncharacterized protein n=1 Tax=Mesonia oceanica TaxID=2687242 RepID=A0AC61Y839_9FLAO|nr:MULTISPECIES: DUF2480 family protein [Mesonia]MAN27627.1 hypothetical protein [Mesonia sp.]MAQ40232.1 hypothetical protein [Mesonia sp.]MBJ97142.1 hypothetical protein [Flavobacteriaceae bacterium]VVV00659.1 hypothetical protein FVB9532_01932 [Mesonia oceanica]|tara:strand:+ start:17732 stop:18241 length:510 start_codon:yes stop_codon:yes gene_type:complete
MAEEIINRVANSKLVTFNLEEYYPQGERVLFDIKDWLYEGFVLREKDFRAEVKKHDWSQYQDKYLALTCSSDAIIPAWAYMLITTELQPYAKRVILGNLQQLETSIYQDIINEIEVEEFRDLPVIVKGCSKKPVPENAYLQIVQKLQPVVKTIMFGEACSSVPLFKKKK